MFCATHVSPGFGRCDTCTTITALIGKWLTHAYAVVTNMGMLHCVVSMLGVLSMFVCYTIQCMYVVYRGYAAEVYAGSCTSLPVPCSAKRKWVKVYCSASLNGFCIANSHVSHPTLSRCLLWIL